MMMPNFPWLSRLILKSAPPVAVHADLVASQSLDNKYKGVNTQQFVPRDDELQQLCARCQDLIDEILNLVATGFFRTQSISREGPIPMAGARCRLCHFLEAVGFKYGSSLIVENMNRLWSLGTGPYHEEVIGQGFTPMVTFENWGERSFAAVLSELPTRLVSPRQICAASINDTLLKNWIVECCENHIQECGLSDYTAIPGLKVIDCQTKTIINPSPDCRYVALSYVWGAQIPGVSNEDRWPRTINDSIILTLSLGYRYLWIDRYCIDQNNASEKHVQIQNMDVIFNNAEVTIIAAAGETPDYGLPGVSSRSRRQQHFFKVNNVELTEIFLFERLVQRSAWSSRAWNLQESVLSRRKLIFTDCEVIFVCNGTHHRESIQVETAAVESGRRQGLLRANLKGELVPPSLHHGDPYTNATRLMQECSARRLSYDTDALNVCLGILKHLRVHHWWGILFQPIAGNCQSHSVYLDWSKNTPGRRRQGFPSWSWTSVSGRNVTGYISSSKSQNHECEIEVPLRGGTWQTIEQWSSTGGSAETLDPRNCLRISGSLVPVELIYGCDFHDMKVRFIGGPAIYEPSGLYALFKFEDDSTQGSSIARVYLDDMEDGVQSLSGVVALVWYKGSKLPRLAPFMILLSPIPGGYKRVGIATWLGPWNIFSLRLSKKAVEPTSAYRVLFPIPVPPPVTFELY